ncbi:MAG: hypothetical protein ACLU38_13515 [Dysosmobacter sp.]
MTPRSESVNLTQDGSKADNQTNAGKTIVLNDRTVEAEDCAVVKNLKRRRLRSGHRREERLRL